MAAAVLLVKMKIEEVLKNPHDRQKAYEIMFQKSQTTSKNHIDDDKEHRKYVPAMTKRTERHTGDGNAKNRVGHDKNAQ